MSFLEYTKKQRKSDLKLEKLEEEEEEKLHQDLSLDPHKNNNHHYHHHQQYHHPNHLSRDVDGGGGGVGGGGFHNPFSQLQQQQDSFNAQQQQQQLVFQHQPQEFHHHHLKTHLFSQQPQLDSTPPLLPTTAAETLPQPIKKRAYSGAGRRTAAMRNAGVGEIVEVQGGHILRATGRKDRHSKVCTAKGPRDRRVRLAAHTAIQFYDVQDRLGYDRPSKAVDWLMNKAKAAIDELDELPAWKPSATAINNNSKKSRTPPGDGDSAALAAEEGEGMYNVEESSDLLPPSLDSDAIADTIKSFFPLNGAVSAAQQHTQFQSYTSPDLISRRGGSHSQDLKLSLQSFQDPMLIGFDNNNNNNNPYAHQRLIGDGGGGGFMLIPPHTPQQHQHQHQHQQQPPLLFGGSNGQTAAHLFHQRGPLQSSNTPSSVRAWMGDYSIGSSSTSAHDFHQAVSVHPVSLSGIGYASSSGGFSGFCIPARIQGDDEEEHDGIPNKPSSASSGSRH